MSIWKTAVSENPVCFVGEGRFPDADLMSMKRSAGQNDRRRAESGRVIPVLEVFGA